MLSVCVMDITKLADDVLYEKAYRLCDKRRQKKADALLQREDKSRCVAAGLLLSYMLRKYGICLKKEELIFSAAGKPYLKEQKHVFFNISHSGKFVACAVCDSEIGIDVQEIKEYNRNVVTRFFAEEELKLFSSMMDEEERSRLFTTLFSSKESFAKKEGISAATVLGEVVPKPYLCRYLHLNGVEYVLTVSV